MTLNTDKLILYVDDETQALKYFSQLFGDQFNIVTADSAKRGMEIIDANPDSIAVLVTDQRMPEKTGVELMEQVRSRYPNIVRVLTTAHTHLESAIKAVNEGGAFRYLTKPWNDEEMVGTLLRASEYHAAMEERDRLVSEKLSMLHRLVVMDRVRGLATAATALDGRIRGAWRALTDYMEQSPVRNRIRVQMDEISGLNMIALARHEAEQMVRTVEIILEDTVRVSTGDEADVDVTDLIKSFVEVSTARLADDDLELALSGVDESIRIHTDRGMLQRLLTIIIRRIADLQEHPARIEISVTSDGESVKISARGDFAELEGDQFASFFAAAIPLKKWPIGLDMDLLSTFMIVHHLGGNLQIQSSPPAGPGLQVSLPIKPPLAAASQAAPGSFDTVYDSLEEWEHEMIAL